MLYEPSVLAAKCLPESNRDCGEREAADYPISIRPPLLRSPALRHTISKEASGKSGQDYARAIQSMVADEASKATKPTWSLSSTGIESFSPDVMRRVNHKQP